MKRRSKGEGCVMQLPSSPYWYASYYQNKKKVRVSTGQTTKQKALIKLRELMHKADHGFLPPDEAKKITYASIREALLQDYVAKNNKSLIHNDDGSLTIKHLGALDAFIGLDTPIASIGPDTSRKFQKKRLEDGVGTASINRSLALLRRMLNLALQDGKLDRPVKVHMMAEPEARQGTLPADKYEELMKCLGKIAPHLRAFISFLYYTATRSGEAKQLKWRQLDWTVGHHGAFYLQGQQSKNKKGRRIYLSSEVAMWLKQTPEEKRLPDERVFNADALCNLRKFWEMACVRVCLGQLSEKLTSPKGFTYRLYSGLQLHDLRRTAVSNMSRSGMREKEIMEQSGHKTRAMFDRYNVICEQDMKDAMQTLERYMAAQKTMQKYAGQPPDENDQFPGEYVSALFEHQEVAPNLKESQKVVRRATKRLTRGLGQDKVQVPISEDSNNNDSPR